MWLTVSGAIFGLIMGSIFAVIASNQPFAKTDLDYRLIVLATATGTAGGYVIECLFY